MADCVRPSNVGNRFACWRGASSCTQEMRAPIRVKGVANNRLALAIPQFTDFFSGVGRSTTGWTKSKSFSGTGIARLNSPSALSPLPPGRTHRPCGTLGGVVASSRFARGTNPGSVILPAGAVRLPVNAPPTRSPAKRTEAATGFVARRLRYSSRSASSRSASAQ